MFNIVHTLFAIFLSQLHINIWFIFILAFLSHWVLDIIPHYSAKEFNRKKFIKLAVIDGILSLILLFTYLSQNSDNIILVLCVVFLATLPDLFKIPELFFNKKYFKKLFFDFHSRIQNEFSFGWIMEIIVFIILIYLVF